MRALVVAACLTAMAGLSSCAITHAQFNARKAELSTTDLCRAWVEAERTRNPDFIRDVRFVAVPKGLTLEECTRHVQQENEKATTAAVGLLAIAAIIVGARSGGGAAPAQQLQDAASPDADTDWDWDEFYNQQGVLVWACRGVQTGRFANVEKCQFKMKLDLRWPGRIFRP